MSTTPDADVLIIGAGVVGLAVARALASAGREVLVVERAAGIGTGVSSRSSEVIHAGIYYPAGSLKARFCVDGRKALYAYCGEHGVPHARTGKLIVANARQKPQLAAIARRACANGVELALLTGAEARALEPELDCAAALYSPETGVVDSHALMLALRGEAEAYGATFALGAEMIGGRVAACGVELRFAGDETFTLSAHAVVICAGLSAPRVARAIDGLPPATVPHAAFAKGSYFSLARRAPFGRLIYPVPEPGGLGVHLTLDLAGRARFGPDVEWLDTNDEAEIDYAVDPARAERFTAAIRRYWPGLQDGELVPDYSGVRPKIVRAGEPDADFMIHDERVHGVNGLVALYGVESPGLTSALAIGEHVAALVISAHRG